LSTETTNIATSTRFYRKIHRWLALPLFVFMMLVGFTGLLLGWKKQAELLPKTQSSKKEKTASNIKIDSIQAIAEAYAKKNKLDPEIDRIDIRPKKGIAKIVFSRNFTELQIDCKSGEILAISTRKSDFIEKIHDGSIIDYFLKNESDYVKLFYTTSTSLGLIILSFSGFWLWYNPIRIRNAKKI
jgi:uncharacterized iron-regulated membrane protein